MRRRDREITDKEEILTIMRKCDVCDVAFFDKKYPYIVPLNFGVTCDGDHFRLFFHGANTGTKLRLLSENPYVGFSMSCSHRLITGDVACDATMEYESVCGNGVMRLVDEDKKLEALTLLMRQYGVGGELVFEESEVQRIVVFILDVEEITGKRLKQG